LTAICTVAPGAASTPLDALGVPIVSGVAIGVVSVACGASVDAVVDCGVALLGCAEAPPHADNTIAVINIGPITANQLILRNFLSSLGIYITA
jgi:hypothetical protein